MPVKRVFPWQPSPGMTVNTQILSELSQCAEALGGVRDGRWKSTLTFYRAMTRDSSIAGDFTKDFLGLVLHDRPDKNYFIIRGRIVVETDTAMIAIMEKLQAYKSRVSLTFEGLQYKMGDFMIRLGKVVPVTSETLRGVMMEVEYLPISSLDKSRQIMEDFLEIFQEVLAKKSLPGHLLHLEPNYLEYGLPDRYSPQHSSVQYASLVAQLITSVRG